MKNKYIQISDLYFEIIEVCDYYNLNDKYEEIIDLIFDMCISCRFKSKSWEFIDYIKLNEAWLIKAQFNKLIKNLVKEELKCQN